MARRAVNRLDVQFSKVAVVAFLGLSICFGALTAPTLPQSASGAQAASQGSWVPSDGECLALYRLAVGNWSGKPVTASVHYIAKSATEMPPFDRSAFYAGRDPSAPSFIWIWLNRNDFPEGNQRARNDALVLAAMDANAAGPRWKQMYDDLGRRDEARHDPADPYHNRHAFLSRVNAIVARSIEVRLAPTADPAIDSEASTVSDADVMQLSTGYYRMGEDVEYKHQEGQATGKVAEYQGRDGNGKYVIVINDAGARVLSTSGQAPQSTSDEMYAAIFAAIADSGHGGPQWKARYDAAGDKTRFGLMLVRAFDLANDHRIAAAHADIAWIHQTVHVKATRLAVQQILAQRNLTIRWDKNTGSVTFALQNNLACGRETSVVFTFDQDRLQSITDSPGSQSCL
jgi:hypothetical protein